MTMGISTNGYALGQGALPASALEHRARWGRRLLWSLIAMVAFTGVIGPYLLPRDIYLFLSAMMGGDYVHQGAVLAQRPWVDIGHRLLGVTLLVAGMLQFNAGLRHSRPVLHRWSGRLFLSLIFVVAATALVMSFSYPFGGATEAVFVVTVSALLLWFAASAWYEAQQRAFAQHREWMIRTLGLSFFISVQRLLFVPIVMAADWPDREIFITTNWLAVILVLIASQYWINVTRPAVPTGP